MQIHLALLAHTIATKVPSACRPSAPSSAAVSLVTMVTGGGAKVLSVSRVCV